MLHVPSIASKTSTGGIAVVGAEAADCAVAPDAPTNPNTTTASNSEAHARMTLPSIDMSDSDGYGRSRIRQPSKGGTTPLERCYVGLTAPKEPEEAGSRRRLVSRSDV